MVGEFYLATNKNTEKKGPPWGGVRECAKNRG